MKSVYIYIEQNIVILKVVASTSYNMQVNIICNLSFNCDCIAS